ncbi:tetratricopeptide repeat protein [Dermacoccus nishinomiyaensis]|uniref:tetratricopeptide repeat protein n=1 Tax=Dermacoccus nishinomiyaensis TaxID=1274 RepID=UPI0013F3C0E4|nr:tetratricopeptide repeat protein [Dermacoccus nishinomiyaensis]MCG7430527.1 hypothetical protein [Dermacoccus nishinomiyaensis]NHC30416.1 tetratricopeptide repeat protein [Dermacoccus nishinomiyaensis]
MPDENTENTPERRERSSRWSQGGREAASGERRPARDDRGSREQRGRFERDDRRSSGRDERSSYGRGSDRRDDRRGVRRDERGYGGPRRDDERGRDDRRSFGRDDRGGFLRDDRGRDDRRSSGRDERGGYGRGSDRRDERGGGFRRDDRSDNRGGFTGRGDRGAGWSDEQSSIRGPRSWDAKAVGDERPRRKPEPVLPEDITGYELDKAVRQQLRTLSKENAEGVAKHLVAAAELLDENPEKALDHAQHAVSRAGRVPAAREALGLVLYRTGEFAEALREFRTARRLSGSDHLLPYMVDCERGLGRYERALELANSPEAQRLSEADNIELAIVVSGVRRDMGQSRAAVVGLRIPALQKATTQPWAARLFYAYADALLDLGEREEARAWFVKADAADRDGETDAADRIDQIDGFELTDLAPEDEQDVDPRLAELDLSAFGAVPPNAPSASVGEQDPRD